MHWHVFILTSRVCCIFIFSTLRVRHVYLRRPSDDDDDDETGTEVKQRGRTAANNKFARSVSRHIRLDPWIR